MSLRGIGHSKVSPEVRITKEEVSLKIADGDISSSGASAKSIYQEETSGQGAQISFSLQKMESGRQLLHNFETVSSDKGKVYSNFIPRQ